MLLDACLQECRLAVRSLRKSPGFTTGTVAILALAIGANSALFSIIHGVLLRPLPYRDDDRLVVIQCERQYADARGPVPATFGLADLSDWRGALRSFDDVAFYLTDPHVLAAPSGSQVLPVAVVSSNFFSMVGGAVAAGRLFDATDGQAPSVVISERLAGQLFAGPREAVGAPLQLDSRPYSVVGVVPRSFALPAPDIDVWLSAEHEQIVKPRTSGFRPLGRLRPGTTLDQARADLDSAVRGLSATNATMFGNGFRASPIGLRDQIVGDMRPTLMIVWVAVGLTLLASCANLANLLLARNAALSRVRAIQSALGASRRRLLLRAVADGGILAAAGAAVGLVLAVALVRGLVRWQPAGIPLLSNVGMNVPVLLFTAGLGVLTAVAIAVLPALAWSRHPPVLNTSVRVIAPVANRRIGRALCVAEFGIAMVLLVGATVLGRSLYELLRTDIGVKPDHVATASLRLGSGQRRDADVVALADRILARAREIPGVTGVGVGNGLPPRSRGLTLTLKLKGDVVDYAATAVTVTPGYLETLGVRLLKGRFFEASDDAAHADVIIMSDVTARRLFGDENPIGRTMPLPTLRDGVKGTAEMTLVGIVAPVKYSGLAAEADEQVYRPFAQQPWGSAFLVARTDRDPASLSSLLRSQIAAVDPSVPVVSIQPLAAMLDEETISARLRSLLLAVIAFLGLVIAAVGLYSVVAYSVSQRSSEIAVRLALGAHYRDVTRMVLREGFVLGVAGILLGLAGACVLAGSLRALVFQVAAVDPASFVISAGLLLLIALVASYVPARRASRVDPLTALRAE